MMMMMIVIIIIRLLYDSAYEYYQIIESYRWDKLVYLDTELGQI